MAKAKYPNANKNKPAPLGNKYAVGNKGGGQPTYDNPDDLADAIQEYFEKGVKVRLVEVGKGDNKLISEIPVPTITGLCIYCGFCSRQSFYDYEKKADFSYIVKRARLFIENEYEEMLHHGNTTGAIFALKQMNWKDRTEQKIDMEINPLSQLVAEISGNGVRGLPNG